MDILCLTVSVIRNYCRNAERRVVNANKKEEKTIYFVCFGL